MRVVLMARDAYEEVAKPLEPYVVVFVLFAVPAAVMATDYCVDHSSAQSTASTASEGNRDTTDVFGAHNIHYGLCDVTCEMILAFRSIATVVACVPSNAC